jgi:hypothetical protein
MSFRLFIYYCALCGGAGAFLGWAVGRILTAAIDPGKTVLIQGLIGLSLGLTVACALGLVDALWNLSLRRIFSVFGRVFVAVLVGSLGGLFGGMIAQLLMGQVDPEKGATIAQKIFLVFGWMLTGLLIGASLGVFELTGAAMANQDTRNPIKKVMRGLIGGLIGGILGGILTLVLGDAFGGLFPGRLRTSLWSPSSWGFVALGACIGLAIAVAQVVLTEAWIKVEAGFRKGREMMLSKPEITIGRAEACDIGLFGDNQIEKVHARIQQRGNDYLLIDNNTPSGTFVNDQRVVGMRLLRSGDLIRVGRCLLRFGERQKK